jgi:hypothetical protein
MTVIDKQKIGDKIGARASSASNLFQNLSGWKMDSSSSLGSSSLLTDHTLSPSGVLNGSSSAVVYSLLSSSESISKIKMCVNPDCGFVEMS